MSVKWSFTEKQKEKLKATAEKLSIPVTVVDTLEEAVPKAYAASRKVKLYCFTSVCKVGINSLTLKYVVIVSLKQ